MRPASEGSDQTDSRSGKRLGNTIGARLSAPAWKVVEAGKDSSFLNEFAEPLIRMMGSIINKEIEAMNKQLKREKRHGLQS